MKFWKASEMMERFCFVTFITGLNRPHIGKDDDDDDDDDNDNDDDKGIKAERVENFCLSTI
jgi:hypothetical protein